MWLAGQLSASDASTKECWIERVMLKLISDFSVCLYVGVFYGNEDLSH